MELTDTIWYMIAGTTAFLGVILGARALWGDRSKGRLRCPKCWYRMEGVSIEGEGPNACRTCPECGRKTQHERRLRRTRRHWRVVLLSMALGASALSAAAWPLVRREGWNLVPTKVLVELVPIGGADWVFGEELLRRLGYNKTSQMYGPARLPFDELNHVAQRLPQGNWLARPMSERWRNSYGEIILATNSGAASPYTMFPTESLSDEKGFQKTLHATLQTWHELPPDLTFRTRPKWPKGIPVWIGVSTRAYWPYPWAISLHVSEDDSTGSHVRGIDLRSTPGFTTAAPERADGVIDLSVDVFRLDYFRLSQQKSTQVPVDTRTVSVPYSIAGTIGDVITAMRSPLLDAAASKVTYEAAWGAGRLNYLPSKTHDPSQAVAFGVIVEFYLDGVLMAKQRSWWDSLYAAEPFQRECGEEWMPFETVPERHKMPWDAKIGEKWTIKMVADPETALRVIERDKYWKGEVEIEMVFRHW